MPCIVTTVHDPATLAETCRRLGLRLPEEGCLQLDQMEASGWIVQLSGLHAPIVFDTLTGLVAYHPRDNTFVPFSRIMRFILRYYDVRAKLRRPERRPVVRTPARRKFHRFDAVGAVA